MRLLEAILFGLCVATLALLGESIVIVSLEEPYVEWVRSAEMASRLWLRYAALFACIGVLAWGVTLPLARSERTMRRATIAVAIVVSLIPIAGGPLTLRPGLHQLLTGGWWGLLTAGALLAAISWVVYAARKGTLFAWRATLAAGLLAIATGPAIATYLVHHLPSQLVTPKGVGDLMLVAACMTLLAGMAATPVLIRLRRSPERGVAGPLVVAVGVLAAVGLSGRLYLLHAAAPPPPPRAVTEGTPVLVVVVDTLRADLGTPGMEEHIDTPRLRRFEDDAVVFERAYSAAPWTIPSFGSLLTSSYPTDHQAGRIDPKLGHKHAMDGSRPSLPAVLQGHGYRTAAILTNPSLSPRYKLSRGFDSYANLLELQWYHPVAFWMRSRPMGLPLMPAQKAYISAETQTLRILEAVRRAEASGGPWFLLAHYMDPHMPYAAPARFYPDGSQGRTQEDHYRAEVRFVDHWLGKLFDELETMGLYDRLLVVFTSDHGEELLENRTRRNHGHGHTLFEEQIRVPLAVKLPGNERAGRRVASPVSLIDVAPTVLSVLGIQAPDGFHGQSVFFDSPDSDRVLMAEAMLIGPERKTAIRGDDKLITRSPPVPETTEAFDLATDPGERGPIDVSGRLARYSALWEAVSERALISVPDGEAIEVDALLREQLEALGYVE